MVTSTKATHLAGIKRELSAKYAQKAKMAKSDAKKKQFLQRARNYRLQAENYDRAAAQ